MSSVVLTTYENNYSQYFQSFKVRRKQHQKNNIDLQNYEDDVFMDKSDLLIDKKLVHKHKKENVFIYNLRRALPRKINRNIMEDKILPALSDSEKAFLLRFYSKDAFPFLLDDEELLDPDYILMSLPHKATFSSIKKLIDFKKISFSDKKLFLKHYYRDKKDKKFYLTDNVDEEDELKMLQITDFKNLHITDEQKSKLSDILEMIDVTDDKEVKNEIKNDNNFFSNMYVKIDHDFFFEHPNEHVPAMMVIESSRQFLLAICHKYFNVPFKDVNFILKGMEVNFMSYLDLNYPIKIVGKINNHKIRKGIIIFIDINVTLWQKGRECASIKYIGKLVSRNIFKVLRNDNIEEKNISRYHPRPIFYHNISIRGANKKKYLCDLIDLSEKGFRVKIHEDFDIQDQEKISEFFMYFQEVGFIHGECEIRWMKKLDDCIIAGFKINNMLEDDSDNLKESIKRFCYVKEEREIV